MTFSSIFLDDTCIIRRNTYSGDKSTLSTVSSDVHISAQPDSGELNFTDTGYASNTYTVFMGDETTVRINDRVVTSSGTKLRVLGIKPVKIGDYLELACVEEIDA